MKILLIVLFIISSLFSKDIIFGVVPQQSPLLLSKKWLPITEELSRLTGHHIIFKTESSIPKFEKALYSGKYDIAYMNPYHFVVANKKIGFNALVRSNKLIQGILVGNKSNKIDLSQITSGIFLFPAPKAFAATLLIKYELKKKYNIDVKKNHKILYVNSHDSVYKGIARNVGRFGGGIMRTYNNLPDKKSKNLLSILYKTDKYPSHPIAINRNISHEIQTEIKDGFLKLSPNLLKNLNVKSIIETKNTEYDVVKDLAIELGIY